MLVTLLPPGTAALRQKFTRALLFASLLLAGAASAQPVPHLAYVYPAGGRAGTTFQVVVGGQALLQVSNALCSGAGIQTTVVECERPMNQNTFNELRDRWQALQQKFQAGRRGGGGASGTNAWTAADAKEREEIREKILKNPPNRSANPAMVDTVVLKLTIATNAAPGEHEIRLATSNALSNPLKFCVGNLPEIAKPPAKTANPALDRFLENLGRKPVPPGTPKYEARVSLPATLNGQIMPGGVDRYRFSARAGQQLILAASARALIPYLADAVPGWFEATLTIFEANGKELTSGERFHLRPDPVIHWEVPHDGDYIVEIHDSIFRGREDFVYRLSLGELPFVTAIFPLGGQSGEKTEVKLTGWNLNAAPTNPPARSAVEPFSLPPAVGDDVRSRGLRAVESKTQIDPPPSTKTLVVDNSSVAPGVTSLTGDFFNAVPFAVGNLPECLASGPNHSTATAQKVTLPIIINGRIARPGESDVYQFAGQAGQKIVAEVFARRMDSPLDSLLRLTDAAGKQLAFNDDYEDKGSGLETHHADSYLTATLPADGTYFVHVSDTQGKAGPEFAYRLRLSEPRPDFALRLVPSSLSIRAGMSMPVTVQVLRKDGFTNAIDLRLDDAPAGFSVSGARVQENQDQVKFTLKAPPRDVGEIIKLAVSGSAIIAGQTVAHPAVPSEDLMQAFAYRHLVPAHELDVLIAANPRPFATDALKLVTATPVNIPAGGAARVRIATPGPAFADRFRLQLRGAPEGITLTNVAQVGNGMELVLVADGDKIKPGANGNLIVDLFPKNAPANLNTNRPAAAQQRPAAGTLPAIPYKVTGN